MACKTPSVTFRTGGVPEAVLDGRTGLVAQQGDLNQMAAHCERLIQDGKLLQTLAEEGRRHAEQTFSYPVIAARTPPCMRKRSGNTVTKSENGRRSTAGLPVPAHPGASSFVIDKKKTPHTLCTVSTLLSP